MAVTIEQVAVALEKRGYTFRQLDGQHLVINAHDDELEMKLFVVLEDGGKYISVQSHQLGSVQSDNPNFIRVLELLAHANERFKLIKFGWSEGDGEITVETRLCLDENDLLTSAQVHRLVGLVPPVCRQVWPEVQRALTEPPRVSSVPAREPRSTEAITAVPGINGGKRTMLWPMIALVAVAVAVALGLLLNFGSN